MPGPRQDLRQQVNALAFTQAGYFSAAQAVAIGYSYQAQKYHVDHGNWVRVDRGLFRLPRWPSVSDDAYARWTVWSSGRGVVSHESALSAHDLSDANPATVHLTVPPGFRAERDGVLLSHAPLPDGDVEDRGAWRVTSPERTLVDVSASDLPQEFVDAGVAEALERGLVTRRRLLRRSADAPARAALRLERALAAERES